jgi:hypothetical protein
MKKTIKQLEQELAEKNAEIEKLKALAPVVEEVKIPTREVVLNVWLGESTTTPALRRKALLGIAQKIGMSKYFVNRFMNELDATISVRIESNKKDVNVQPEVKKPEVIATPAPASAQPWLKEDKQVVADPFAI